MAAVEDCFAEADSKGVEYVWAEVKQEGEQQPMEEGAAGGIPRAELAPGLQISRVIKVGYRWCRLDACIYRACWWVDVGGGCASCWGDDGSAGGCAAAANLLPIHARLSAYQPGHCCCCCLPDCRAAGS